MVAATAAFELPANQNLPDVATISSALPGVAQQPIVHTKGRLIRVHKQRAPGDKVSELAAEQRQIQHAARIAAEDIDLARYGLSHVGSLFSHPRPQRQC